MTTTEKRHRLMSTFEEEGGEPKGYEKVPATVFGHLLPGELRIILAPGYGMGGAPRDILIELVPPELRIPNTRIWVRWAMSATGLETFGGRNS